jgi:hypothetical protein
MSGSSHPNQETCNPPICIVFRGSSAMRPPRGVRQGNSQFRKNRMVKPPAGSLLRPTGAGVAHGKMMIVNRGFFFSGGVFEKSRVSRGWKPRMLLVSFHKPTILPGQENSS